MILEESGRSFVSKEQEGLLTKVAYSTVDVRPAWMGACFPDHEDQFNRMMNWARVHYLYYLSFVKEFMDLKGDVLDVGSGAGQATNMLGRYSNYVLGLDTDRSAIDFSWNHNHGTNVDYTHGNVFELTRLFDYVFCIETLEHIEYDKQDDFVNKLISLCKQGVFITTPIAYEGESGGGHIGLFGPNRLAQFEITFKDNLVFSGTLANHEHTFVTIDTNVTIGKPTHYRFVLK